MMSKVSIEPIEKLMAAQNWPDKAKITYLSALLEDAYGEVKGLKETLSHVNEKITELIKLTHHE